jgi:hypothetical protein
MPGVSCWRARACWGGRRRPGPTLGGVAAVERRRRPPAAPASLPTLLLGPCCCRLQWRSVVAPRRSRWVRECSSRQQEAVFAARAGPLSFEVGSNVYGGT